MNTSRAMRYRVQFYVEGPSDPTMTIAALAAALRGVPRDPRLLIDAPEGLKG